MASEIRFPHNYRSKDYVMSKTARIISKRRNITPKNNDFENRIDDLIFSVEQALIK